MPRYAIDAVARLALHLAREELIMGVTQPAQPAPIPPPAASVRPRNGLGVAALVIGVASLVAGISFVLFPLGSRPVPSGT